MIFEDLDPAEFVPVAPAKAGPARADVTLRAFRLRSAERLRLALSERIVAELGAPVRFALAFSAARRLLLLTRDDERGRYELGHQGRGARPSVMFPVPTGLVFAQGAEDPEFWVDAGGGRLAVEVPAFLRSVAALPAPRPNGAALVEAARKAVPAPSFSGPPIGRR